MVQHRRGGRGYDPIRRSSVQRWHDARLRELDEQEAEQRNAEQSLVVAARAARGGATGQTVQQVPTRPSADSPQGIGLARAERVVGALAAQSGEHPGIGWSAGVAQVSGQITLFATSNEGLGYIPAGIVWDRAARLVFDPTTPIQDATSWQGLYDPARIVAERCLRLAQSRNGGVQLLAVASTEPIGDRVMEFIASRGAGMAERVPAAGRPGSGGGTHRAEVVMPGTLGQAASMHPWQRWNAAKALLRDAARLAEVAKTYPKLYEMVRGVEAGNGDWSWIDPVREWERFLVREAQSRRVTEERLGAVTGASIDRTTVLPPGGGSAYALPFFAARVCSILTVLLRRDSAERTLEAEELADVAYEHHSVSENQDATRRFLAQGPSGQEQRYGGAS